MKSGIEQLRTWIARQGLTQREAAKALGWEESMMSHVLAGRRNLGLMLAAKVYRLTGIPIEAWASSRLDELDAEPVAAGRKRK